MQGTHPENSSVLPTDTPLPTVQTMTDNPKTKTTSRPPEVKSPPAKLRALRPEALTVSQELSDGWYQGQSVTIRRLSSSLFAQHRESLSAWAQSASPFWLPTLGVCEDTKTSDWVWVMSALPDTRLDDWLASIASVSWTQRCGLLRDVAVGVYHQRAVGADYITWDAQQVYLDKQGRVQLAPLFRETPQTEADEVYALGQLIWQLASRQMQLVNGWEQGKGLPRDCPPAVIVLVK